MQVPQVHNALFIIPTSKALWKPSWVFTLPAFYKFRTNYDDWRPFVIFIPLSVNINMFAREISMCITMWDRTRPIPTWEEQGGGDT